MHYFRNSFSVVLENEDLFMCGWNSKGQLGLGDTDDRPLLCHVPFLALVKQVSCGWNHTLAITGNCNSSSVKTLFEMLQIASRICRLKNYQS